jgi:hypothetical protein
LQSNFAIDAIAPTEATTGIHRTKPLSMIFSIEEESKGIPLLRVRDIRPSPPDNSTTALN